MDEMVDTVLGANSLVIEWLERNEIVIEQI